MSILRTATVMFLILLIYGCASSKGVWVSRPAKGTATSSVFEASIEPLKYENPFFVAFRLSVKNISNEPVAIDWNQTIYLSNRVKRGVFIFKGVSPEDLRDKTIPPDMIQPGETLEKDIAPFRLLAGAPLKSRHKTDSRISAGMLDEGEAGALLVIRSGERFIKKSIITTISYDQP